MLAQVGGHPNSVRPNSELVWILLNSTFSSMRTCACLTWGRKSNIYSSKIQPPAWISARPDLIIVWVYAHLVWTVLQIPLKIPCSSEFRPAQSICSWASRHAQVGSVGCAFEWNAFPELLRGDLCGAVRKETSRVLATLFIVYMHFVFVDKLKNLETVSLINWLAGMPIRRPRYQHTLSYTDTYLSTMLPSQY